MAHVDHGDAREADSASCTLADGSVLRADVVYVLPEGGLNALASVLERFRTFHENLESISESSHASLTRIIRWLKGGN